MAKSNHWVFPADMQPKADEVRFVDGQLHDFAVVGRVVVDGTGQALDGPFCAPAWQMFAAGSPGSYEGVAWPRKKGWLPLAVHG